MNNCKDCRYWQHQIDMWNHEWSECGFIDLDDEFAEAEDTHAFIYADAADDTGLRAELRTGPMFGCVRFQHL